MSGNASIVNLKLRDLIDASGKTRKEIALNLNCDISTITKHYRGDRDVTTEFVIKYAKYFNVSTDYLLGLSDVETTDKDVQFICEYTGLKEESVNWLHNLKYAEQEDNSEAIEEKKNIINSLILLDGNISSIGKLSDLFFDYCSAIDSAVKQKERAVLKLVTNGVSDDVESNVRLFKDFTDMSDLTLFRMQQTVLKFTMLYCKETLKRLDRVDACLKAMEEYLFDKKDYSECDLKVIREIGEDYGYYPKEE